MERRNFMDAENYTAAFYKDYRWAETYGKEQDGYALLAAVQLYETTQKAEYLSVIRNYFDAFLSENGEIAGGLETDCSGSRINVSRCLFFLYDETGEEKYRKAVGTVMNRLRTWSRCECGNFVCGTEKTASVDALYMLLPFYTAYETVYDKKEKYNDIIGQFENVRKLLYDTDKECGGVQELPLMDRVKYLTALVDTIDCMSIEIYEQYRKLQDMFRQALQDVLQYRKEEKGVCENALIAYCILKACGMGIILKEKYVGTGMEIVEKLAEAELPEKTGVFVSACGQYLRMKKELEA